MKAKGLRPWKKVGKGVLLPMIKSKMRMSIILNLVPQRHLAHCFSAVLRPFCAVFPPFFCAVRLPGAETERTGEKWRKMGEIWGRNGRETAVAEWRWEQATTAACRAAKSTWRCSRSITICARG